MDSAKKRVTGVGEATGFVQKQVEALKAKITDLTSQLNNLGTDGSQSIEDIEIASKKLRQEIRGAQRDLVDFEKILKTMATAAANAGTQIGEGMAFAGMDAFKKS